MARRRFAVYFSWSRPCEIDVELGILENRFPTLFEFRRAIWPLYEWAANPERYRQDVSGFLDHVILFDFQAFHKVIETETGLPPQVLQREGGQPPTSQLDDSFLEGVDTLIVVSLDHLRTNQQATPAEIEAIQAWSAKQGKCLVICPHHDVGVPDDLQLQEEEFHHHGDRLVPVQQRLGGFARSLLQGLGIPVANQYGLNPARSTDGTPASLEIHPEDDQLKLLEGVTTFNLHPHLPHLSIAGEHRDHVRILARQPINPDAARHPFTSAGNRYFNAFLWAPPQGNRAANLVICDATLWSAAFGGVRSLSTLWRNLANLP